MHFSGPKRELSYQAFNHCLTPDQISCGSIFNSGINQTRFIVVMSTDHSSSDDVEDPSPHIYDIDSTESPNLIIKEINPKYIKKNSLDLQPEILFPINSTWLSLGHVRRAMNTYSSCSGFVTLYKGRGLIRCNCYRKGANVRSFAHGSIHKSCEFKLQLGSTHHMVTGKGEKKVRRQDFENGAVFIRTFNSIHTGTCNPSKQQFLLASSRSRKYTSNIPIAAYWYLCTQMNRDDRNRISSTTVKNILSKNFPPDKNVTRQHVFNTIVTLKRLLPHFQECSNFNDFEKLLDNRESFQQFELNTINEDEATFAVTSLWKDYVDAMKFDNDLENEEAHLKTENFHLFLQLISQKVKGFTYQLATDSQNKCNGVIWMTASMRSNYERFGSYISLDCMKRELNKSIWPYFAISMINDVNKVCVGCEALLIGERDEAYKFILLATEKMAPVRRLTDVLILSGDGFFTQEKIRSWGLINAKYIADYWHLFNGVLQDRFSNHVFNDIKTFLKGMAMCNNELEYLQAYQSAKSLLENRSVRNFKAENELTKFHNERHTYSSYLTKTLPGNQLRHGSSASEINHSSVLSNIAPRNKHYMVSPQEMIRDLLLRQRSHTNEINSILYGNTSMIENFLYQKKDEYSEFKDSVLKASKSLNWISFQLFYKELLMSKNYLSSQIDGVISVYYKKNNPMDGRRFATTLARCSCSTRVSFLGTCRHELHINNEFNIGRFDIRNHLRTKSSVSFQTGTTINIPSVIDELNDNQIEDQEGKLNDNQLDDEGGKLNADNHLEDDEQKMDDNHLGDGEEIFESIDNENNGDNGDNEDVCLDNCEEADSSQLLEENTNDEDDEVNQNKNSKINDEQSDFSENNSDIESNLDIGELPSDSNSVHSITNCDPAPNSSRHLSKTQVMNITSEIVNNYDRMTNEHKVNVSAMMIMVHNLCERFSSNSSEMYDKVINSTADSLDSQLQSILDKYNNSFLPNNNAFQITGINEATSYARRHASRSRKKSNREINSKRKTKRLYSSQKEVTIRPGKKRKDTAIKCSFCSQSGHRITNCQRRAELESMYKKIDDASEYISFLEEKVPIKDPDHKASVVRGLLSKSCHIIVHRVHANHHHNPPYPKLKLSEMTFVVTALDGHTTQPFASEQFIPGTELQSAIHKISSMKKYNVYDGCRTLGMMDSSYHRRSTIENIHNNSFSLTSQQHNFGQAFTRNIDNNSYAGNNYANTLSQLSNNSSYADNDQILRFNAMTNGFNLSRSVINRMYESTLPTFQHNNNNNYDDDDDDDDDDNASRFL